jgi:hypothetical protein
LYTGNKNAVCGKLHAYEGGNEGFGSGENTCTRVDVGMSAVRACVESWVISNRLCLISNCSFVFYYL